MSSNNYRYGINEIFNRPGYFVLPFLDIAVSSLLVNIMSHGTLKDLAHLVATHLKEELNHEICYIQP